LTVAAGLRVAIVGYGLSGRVLHAPLVSATPGMSVASVVTTDAGRAAQAAHDLAGVRVLTDPEELWRAAEDHDLVVVASATASHAELTVRALEAGLPVVVEKPVAVTTDDARSMSEAAHHHGLPVVPFFNRRWDSDHLTLKRLLAERALGQVRRYESRFERWRLAVEPAGWRDSLASSHGGGVLLDLGVHLVDQALELFGPVDRVYAEMNARRAQADDDVFVALRHHSGVRSHLWASAVSAAPGPRLRVLGSTAAFVSAHLDGQEAALRAGTRPDSVSFGEEPPERWGRLRRGEDAAPEPVPSARGAWDSFYPAVRATLEIGSPPPVRFEDAVSVQLVLDAARRAAGTGAVVGLSD